MEVLAGKIMAQFARRSILVVDVEVYEFVRKKVNFREEKDGIKIKNKKFRFDDGPTVTLEDYSENGNGVEQQLAALLVANPQLLSQIKGQVSSLDKQVVAQPKPPVFDAPIRYEIFEPVDTPLVGFAKERGWRFTLGKKYPVYEEKAGTSVTDGMFYTTIDDAGKRLLVNDKFFVPVPKGLAGKFMEDSDDNVVGASNVDQQSLSWDGVVSANMPNIR